MYGVTAIRCHNWHNLLEQDHATNGGDLILIGESGTGKTTALDAMQYVLTGGLEAQWNAAANPVHSITELKERGRSLTDILLRYTDERGNLAPEGPVIAYFGVELTDDETQEVLSIALGAKVDSHEARAATEWWFLRKGIRLKQVQFEAGGFVHDKQTFQQANGRDFVYDTGRYRVQLAHELFPETGGLDSGEARETLRQWAKYLNLGKAYGRMAKIDVGKLLQDALPAPDRAIFEEAKRGFAEIATIHERVRQAEANLVKLNLVHAELATARLNGQRLSATQYARRAIDSNRLNGELEQLAAAQREHGARAEAAGLRRTRIDDQIKAADSLLDSIANPNEEAMFRDLERLRQEIKAADAELAGLEAVLKELQRQVVESRTKAEEARRALADAKTSAVAAVLTAAESQVGKLRESLQALIDALRADSALADLGALRKRIDTEKNVEVARLTRLEEQQTQRVAVLQQQTKSLAEAINQATSETDVAPRDSTAVALAAAGKGARVLYQCLEVKVGAEKDAVLLQEFLGAAVLGAVLPSPDQGVEDVRRRIHKVAPETLVVDAGRLPDLGRLGGILACIDVEGSDALAVRYLQANHGDVGLADSGDDPNESGRTVWRDGLVLDGRAWHIEVGTVLRFIGSRARQAARQARIEQLRSELGIANADLAKARKQVAALIGDRTKLQNAVGDALQQLDEADLATKVAWVVAAKDAEERHAAAHQKHEGLVADKKLRLADAKASEERFKVATASKDVKARQAKRTETRAVIEALRVDRDAAIALGSIEAAAAKAATEGAAGRKEALAGLADRLRAHRDELINKWNALDPDAYVREEGFMSQDGLDGKDLHMADMNYARSQTRAVEQVRQLVGDLVRQGEDLDFIEAMFSVRESRSGISLDDRIHVLAEETKTKRKEQVERTKRIYDAQSIHPIAEMLKRELLGAEAFVDRLNKELERTLYTGKQFRLSMRQKPEFAQYIRLVRTYSASSPGNLQEWLQSTLSDDTKTPDQLLEMFDYRNWFSYELRKVRDGVEGALAANVTNSGGEQAGNHYMLTYAMLAMFYHKQRSRIRLVVLDEAFRGVDAKNKMGLYAMAKDLGLLVLLANTDFEGHTTMPVTVDVLMFQKDPETLETFIQTYNRRMRVAA